jgi:hypothetical protein
MSHSAHKSAPPETADDRDREDNTAIPPPWHLSNSPIPAPRCPLGCPDPVRFKATHNRRDLWECAGYALVFSVTVAGRPTK